MRMLPVFVEMGGPDVVFGTLLEPLGLSPRFMDSTLSYGPKRKGPPSIAKDWRLAVLLLHCVLFPIIINWF